MLQKYLVATAILLLLISSKNDLLRDGANNIYTLIAVTVFTDSYQVKRFIRLAIN